MNPLGSFGFTYTSSKVSEIMAQKPEICLTCFFFVCMFLCLVSFIGFRGTCVPVSQRAGQTFQVIFLNSESLELSSTRVDPTLAVVMGLHMSHARVTSTGINVGYPEPASFEGNALTPIASCCSPRVI